MKNKLRSLLQRDHGTSSMQNCAEDTFIPLDEAMARQLRANYGQANDACGKNGECSNNGKCIGNKSCKNNGTCV